MLLLLLLLLLLSTNRKSHTGFRLVPKSVTLNDLERLNDRRPALSLVSVNYFEDSWLQRNQPS